MGAPGNEFVEQGHAWIGLGGRRGLQCVAEIGEQQGVDGIGLGEPAAGAGKVARQPGIDHTDQDIRLVQGGDERPVVGPGGFADDVDRRRTFSDDFDQDTVTGGVIGDGGGDGEMGTAQIDGEFGDIGTDIDRRGEHG